MKIKKAPNGNIAIQATLGTMEVGETWKLEPERYDLRYLRVSCSLFGSAVNKSFTVSFPAGSKKVLITRNR